MQAFPDVSVELTLSNRVIDLVEEGYDLVFHVGELRDSCLIARRLAPYELVICASPRYLATHPPIRAPGDLSNHECLIFQRGPLQGIWHMDGPEGRVSVSVSGSLSADNGGPLTQAALAAMGIVMQPRELVAREIEQGLLVPVLESYRPPVLDMHMLYAPDRRVTPKLRSFLDFSTMTFGAA